MEKLSLRHHIHVSFLLVVLAGAWFVLALGASTVHADQLARGCGAARTPAQWRARCFHTGKRGITLIAGPGRHVLRGTAANDTLLTGAGRHVVYAKAGNDRVSAGPGPDTIVTGPGSDLILAQNGYIDTVSCGRGHNIVAADRFDRVKHCAIVLRATGMAGSRSHPIPFGRSAQLGDGWRLRIAAAYPDATKRVIAAGNGQNSPPPKGHQFFLVKISAVRTGKTLARLYAGYRFRAAPGPKRPYTTFDDPCGILPPVDLEIVNQRAHRGQRVRGYICWDVRRRDAGRLVMFNAGGFHGAKQLYFALR
jgi:hypothetical protein